MPPLAPAFPLAPVPPLPALSPLLPLFPLPPWVQGNRASVWRNGEAWAERDDERRTRPWMAAPHYYRPGTNGGGAPYQAPHARDYNSLLHPADERHVTGVPFLDTFYKGNWVLPTPNDPHGAFWQNSTETTSWMDALKPAMRPAEIALLLIWMVKKEIISPLTFPFLMMLHPMFTDGDGHLSFMQNMRGALPVFQVGMGGVPPPPPPMAEEGAEPPVDPDYYAVTWLSAKSLAAAEFFVGHVLGLAPTGTHPRGCTLYQSAPSHHLAVCEPKKTTYLAARTSAGAMRCDATDVEGAAADPTKVATLPLAYSLVVASAVEVYAWYDRLVWANSNATVPVADLTAPAKHQSSFGFYFSDANRETGLGCMRFEVVSFADDSSWPAPTCAAVAGDTLTTPPGGGAIDASIHPRGYSKSRELSLKDVEARHKADAKIRAEAPTHA